MAIGTGAAILGGSILAGGASIIGSNRAARAVESGGSDAIAEQRRQFNELLRLTGPQRQIGNEAINELSRLFGFEQPQTNALQPFAFRGAGGELVSPGFTSGGNDIFPAGTGPDIRGEEPVGLDVFEASPDFEFRRGEGLEGIAQTLGAGGTGAFSGNALRSLNEFNSNLASGEFGDFVNRRLALAGLGQTASSQAGAGALQTGANVGNALINQGNARASGILGQTAGVGNTLKDIIDALVARNQRNSVIDSELSPLFADQGIF